MRDARTRSAVGAESPRVATGSIDLLIAYGTYPFLIVLAFVVLAVSRRQGLPLAAASFSAAFVSALAVALFEWWRPHRDDWRPSSREIQVDSTYIAIVQVALPLALAVLASQLLAATIGDALPYWPSTWPLAAQIVLMLLVADFLRYWLHYFAHHSRWLWRLHAIHHSPTKLYWLNVARFHPFEKTLQYLFDALPFVIVGVSPEVVAGYFVFYATNGFVQHSNIDLRLGLLNWIVSGPELHRWHHSRRQEESNANYGNNLILWDVVFGTRFLPAGREAARLGLRNRAYPESIVEQLKAPFIAGLDRGRRPIPSWGRIIVNALLAVQMAWTRLTAWRRLDRATRRPMATQRRVLARIIAAGKKTRFGCEHDFDRIASIADYQRALPILDYDTLKLYRGELTCEATIAYARSSGTSGTPKDLPMTRAQLARLRRDLRVATYLQYRRDPAPYQGSILGVVSPALEGTSDDGIPYGAVSGQIYRGMPAVARSKYVVPPEVFELDDHALEYRLIVRLALSRDDITLLATANPSTFLRLARVLDEERESLIGDVEHDRFEGSDRLPPQVERAVRDRLRCSLARKKQVREALSQPETRFAKLWPHIRLVNTWTRGSCGVAISKLRELLPNAAAIVDLGYLASEFRGTITIDAVRGLPTIEDHFFEFFERDAWIRSRDDPDAECPRALTLDDVRVGREYLIVVTTATGLYRYFMNDVVRIGEPYRNTPTLTFLQTGLGMTSITGEKLYESQVIDTVQAVLTEHEVVASFFVMLADVDDARYRLWIELWSSAPVTAHLAKSIDARLSHINIEYREKRASERLGAVDLRVLRLGTHDHYRDHCVRFGMRASQFKPRALRYAREAGGRESFDFARFEIT